LPVKEETGPKEVNFEYNTNLGIGYMGGWNQITYPSTIDQLKRVLMNPQTENKALRDMCWWAYTSNGIIRNVVDYMVSLPTLDRIIYTKDKRSDGKKPARYARNKALFTSVLDTIKDKEIIRDSILKSCNDGVSFYYLITNQKPLDEKFIDPLVVAMLTQLNTSNSANYSLFALPTDYCKIVSIKNNSYEIAFDLNYFSQFIAAGLSRKLMLFPKEIRDAWKKYNYSTGTNRWLVLDNSKTIVTKVGAKREEVWGRPLAAGALADILFYNYFIDTKRNTLDAINNEIIYQTFPEGKEKGLSVLTGDQQQKQHETIKSALNNRKQGQWGQAFFSLAAGTKLEKLDVNPNIFTTPDENSMLEKIAGDVGFGLPLLNGTSKGNYAVLKLNLELVSSEIFSWINQFCNELNKVINANIIQDNNCRMEVDYLPITNVNKTDMIGYMSDLYLKGRGPWQSWVAASGLSFDSFIAMLEDESLQGLENKFTPHVTSYTLSKDNAPGGRPENPNPTSENTVQSQANDSNNLPSPGST